MTINEQFITNAKYMHHGTAKNIKGKPGKQKVDFHGDWFNYILNSCFGGL